MDQNTFNFQAFIIDKFSTNMYNTHNLPGRVFHYSHVCRQNRKVAIKSLINKHHHVMVNNNSFKNLKAMQKCSQPKTKKILYKSSPQLRSTSNVTRAQIPAGDSTRAVHALHSPGQSHSHKECATFHLKTCPKNVFKIT